MPDNIPDLIKLPEVVEVQADWCECERGNTWLTGTGGMHYALLDFDDKMTLEISILPDNYPGLNVALVRTDEASFAAFIQKRYVGWYVRKCNLPGVKIKGGRVEEVEDNPEEEEDEDEA